MSILPPYSPKAWKVIIYTAIGLVVLGIVLFAFDRCGSYWTGRDINKAKGNVANALNAVNAQKDVVAGDKVAEAVAVEKVAEAAKDVIEASTATAEAKQEATDALNAYKQAKNANLPVGTTEQNLLDKLNKLDQ